MRLNLTQTFIFQTGRLVVAAVRSALIASALLLALSPAVAAAPPQTMLFEQVAGVGCPASGCVLAVGAIGAATAHDFAVFVRVNAIQPGALLVLDSQGGDLTQAMKLGLSIRHAHLSTRVQRYDRRAGAFHSGGSCTAECVYAFLGGIQRSVGGEAKLGVRQFTANTEQPALECGEVQRLTDLISTYSSAMGATSELLITVLSATPDHTRWLSPIELATFAMVTRV